MYKFLLLKSINLIIILLFSVSANAFESYVYDVMGRLTKVTYTDGSTISYVYDVNGSRLASIPAVTVNQVPVVNNDAATTLFDTLIAIDVLANDTDSDGTIDATSVVIVEDVTNGVTNVDAATGVVNYTPNAGFSGADSFTYTVNDDQGATSNVATVSVTVNAAPPPPMPPPPPTNSGGGGSLGFVLLAAISFGLTRRKDLSTKSIQAVSRK